MEGYYFNNELFTKLYVAMEMSMADILQGTGIPVGTWRNYKRSADVPLMALVKICNANRIPIEHFICWEEPKPVMIGKRHYVMANGFKEIAFLNQEFGDEVTVAQGRNVADACKDFGLSSLTFYRNFRNTDCIGSSFGVGAWLLMCNKTKTYPMDFLTSNGMDVPVLRGYHRRQVVDAGVLAQRNKDMKARNERLSQELRTEKEKVKELEAEVERLKSALYDARRSGGDVWSGRAAENIKP